ncbi:hypothetical protein ACTHTM_11535, partial [Neisseria sp. P0018.S003]|uniref:hypothetical protein n=1 Tax=Neisseria sp. P0018.S003 TaxID=3436789 RepID=UPI003F7E1EA8
HQTKHTTPNHTHPPNQKLTTPQKKNPPSDRTTPTNPTKTNTPPTQQQHALKNHQQPQTT